MKNAALPLQSLKDFLKTYTLLSGGTIDYEEKLFICYRNPSTLFSRYILTSADSILLKQVLDLITNAPVGSLPVFVTYDEAFMPADTKKEFEKRGFEIYIIQQGMVMDLSKAEEPSKNPHVILADQENIDQWSEALFEGFCSEKPYEPFVYQTLIGTPEMDFYGYNDNDFLGTTILFKDNNNAGIHDVAVSPAHRQKGISKALLLQALYDMKKAGGTFISLQASPLGEFLYRSVGFENTSKIYTWKRP